MELEALELELFGSNSEPEKLLHDDGIPTADKNEKETQPMLSPKGHYTSLASSIEVENEITYEKSIVKKSRCCPIWVL